MTTLELVRFTVPADRVEPMLSRRPAMEAALTAVPGFRSAVLVRHDDGTYTDVVTWDSLEQALAAAEAMQAGTLPEPVLSWAGTLGEVLSFEHAEVAGRGSLPA